MACAIAAFALMYCADEIERQPLASCEEASNALLSRLNGPEGGLPIWTSVAGMFDQQETSQGVGIRHCTATVELSNGRHMLVAYTVAAGRVDVDSLTTTEPPRKQKREPRH